MKCVLCDNKVSVEFHPNMVKYGLLCEDCRKNLDCQCGLEKL